MIEINHNIWPVFIFKLEGLYSDRRAKHPHVINSILEKCESFRSESENSFINSEDCYGDSVVEPRRQLSH